MLLVCVYASSKLRYIAKLVAHLHPETGLVVLFHCACLFDAQHRSVLEQETLMHALVVWMVVGLSATFV